MRDNDLHDALRLRVYRCIDSTADIREPKGSLSGYVVRLVLWIMESTCMANSR